MEVTKIKTGRQKNMEAEKLIEALHTVEKLKRTMRHCYTSDDRKESVAEHCWRVALMAYWMEDIIFKEGTTCVFIVLTTQLIWNSILTM